MRVAVIAGLTVLAALLSVPAVAQDASLHNTEIFASPWTGEARSKGTFSVRHEGKGSPPEKGYFLKHEPGEIAEFHLFVPDGIDPEQKVPLLIAYHGGKDGASGKGTCGSFARVSTVEHPVIVLAPNMYTMDAYHEIVAEGKLPIDTRRVVVYGHSSGGMGVRSAMAEFTLTKGSFRPAALICSSTTASLGQAPYPPCTYYVMAGEKETPEFVKNQILRERRRTCRVHALLMQQVFRDVRYLEIPGSGHAGGTKEHLAVLQHAIAVSARDPVRLTVRSDRPELEPLLAAARAGEWTAVRAEMKRLDGLEDLASRPDTEKVREAVLDALETWFAAQTKAIAGLTPDSDYATRDRAFLRFERCREVAAAFNDTRARAAVARSLASLDTAPHWPAELEARKAYRAIVMTRPGPELKPKLEALRRSAPRTEYGRNRTREKLSALQVLGEAVPPPPEGPPIVNPYYPKQAWRVWRDDATPVPNVRTLVREGKGKDRVKKPAMITLAPTPEGRRIYPAGPLRDGEPIRWETLRTPSKRFAGVWDDVYASWSGLHGYVRSSWQATDGSAVHLRPKALDHIMHFVETRKTADLQRCGINFVHQSTTGMAHTITNAYDPRMTTSYERIYFTDCLVTAPAHASFTEDWADRTRDLYLALVPTLFNSVGSSSSETMAITKMIIAGGYLPPESKRTLKRNGLYPSAMLYLWKAALPYDVPYDHELRHRIAYRALGGKDRQIGYATEYKGGYGHAGPDRGNLSLEYHRYDEVAHLRNMIRLAQAMTVLPPEAILDAVKVEGGKSVYALRKAALVLQEPGQDVTVNVSTARCYDLARRPITVRWKLLHGNHATTCEPGDEPDTWVIRVPWDDTLPEGRTAVALVANNGEHDGNPAIVTVYRKRGALPPAGYGYDSPHANRRPVILGLQDRIVKPGEKVTIALRAVDPEGQTVRFHKRAGEPGDLDGSLYTFEVPKGPAEGSHVVTFIASDGTAGNSYSARRVSFVVAPRVHAHIECETLTGPAPFTVKVSAEGSRVASGKMELGWEFYAPVAKRKPAEWAKQPHGPTATHTFAKPGLYEVALTVKSGKDVDRETVHVRVTDGPPPAPAGGVIVEGNDVRIADGDESPSAFDHTHLGTVAEGARIEREFILFNRGAKDLSTTARTVTIGGPQAKEFRVARRVRRRIAAGGHASFVLAFRPRGSGPRKAEVTVRAGGETIRFAISGEGIGR